MANEHQTHRIRWHGLMSDERYDIKINQSRMGRPLTPAELHISLEFENTYKSKASYTLALSNFCDRALFWEGSSLACSPCFIEERGCQVFRLFDELDEPVGRIKGPFGSDGDRRHDCLCACKWQ
jgi:hypothetical protein